MDEPVSGPLDKDRLFGVLEALLFASGEPVQPSEIAEAFDMELGEVVETLEELRRSYDRDAQAGLTLESVAGGYRLATRSDLGDWVRLFFRRRNRTRLSPAALETLAIVAYRQPVTVPEIQAIRGKDPTAALKNLVDKRLLRILGKKKVVGSPLLYGTSKQFLIHFGLDSLDDLPSIEEFDQFMGALETVEAIAEAEPAEAGAEAEPAPDVARGPENHEHA